MLRQRTEKQIWLSPAERLRLVRFCSALAGQSDVAEDLAQETLVVAWQHRHRLYAGVEQGAWLAGIARRVCLRWRRRFWQDRLRQHPAPAETSNNQPFAAPEVEFEAALTQAELIDLLDRALALLPPDTRGLLIRQYVDEMPRAEIAARLSIKEGTVAVRLHRGKIALRYILEHELYEDALAHGLIPPDVNSISNRQITRLWCPLCGQEHLTGHYDAHVGSLALGCSRCLSSSDYIQAEAPRLFTGVKGYRPAVKRLLAWSHCYFQAAAQSGNARCFSCGSTSSVKREEACCLPEWPGPIIRVNCETCRAACTGALSLIFSPSLLKFWQQHPRMRLLHRRPVIMAGRKALLTSFGSVTDSSRIELVQAWDTLEMLHSKEL